MMATGDSCPVGLTSKEVAANPRRVTEIQTDAPPRFCMDGKESVATPVLSDLADAEERASDGPSGTTETSAPSTGRPPSSFAVT